METRKNIRKIFAVVGIALTIASMGVLAGVMPVKDQGSAYQFFKDDALKCTKEEYAGFPGVTDMICTQEGSLVTDYQLVHADEPALNPTNWCYDASCDREQTYFPEVTPHIYSTGSEQNVAGSISGKGLREADNQLIWVGAMRNLNYLWDLNQQRQSGLYFSMPKEDSLQTQNTPLEEGSSASVNRYNDVVDRQIFWQGQQKQVYEGYQHKRIGRTSKDMIPESSEDKYLKNIPLTGRND